jgi:ribosomal-protein-alanine N-acetyltransferase
MLGRSRKKRDGQVADMNDLRLETPRLFLRLMTFSDKDELMKIFGDPIVMDSFGVQPFNREQMTAWIQRNIDHQDLHGYGLFSVILRSEKQLIGNCGLEHMELYGNQEVELGYDFRRDYWGQGYATEAATAVRDFAFEVLQLPRLMSLIRVGNEASKRVSEKIGMCLVDEISRIGIPYWVFAIDRKPNAGI